MTWARTRARASNASHIKQDSMGIGVNAAARIDREHSSCNAAIEKTQAELRLEVAVREKRRRELEFLEKGGDPLDFEFGDTTLSSQLSTVSVAGLFSLSDSEANLKEKKLFFLQSKQFNHVESKRGIDGYGIHQVRPGVASRINGQVARDCCPASVKDSQLLSSLGRLARNNLDTTGNELSRQISSATGTPPSVVRVKEGKCLTSTISHENRACSDVVLDTVPENSANSLLSAVEPSAKNREGKVADSEENNSVREDKVEVKTASFLNCSERVDRFKDSEVKTVDTSVREQKINNSKLETIETSHVSVREDKVNNSERKAISPISEGNENGREQILGSQNQDSNYSGSADSGIKAENRKRIRTNEDELLKDAEAIKAAKQCAARKPLPGPARRKSHWDFVLEEMAWMANDFMQERLWKTAAAAQVCRCAAKAAFWCRAEALTKAAVGSVKLENMDVDNSLPEAAPAVSLAEIKRLPLENYACRFFKNTMGTYIANAPCTPERQEPVSSWVDQGSLHFLMPYGANEAYRISIEDSWASNVAAYDRELQKQKLAEAEIENEEALLTTKMSSFGNVKVAVKREEHSEGSDQTGTVKKKRKLVLKANIEKLEQSADGFTEFLDNGGATKGIPVKKLRTSGVSGRQRLEKLTGHTKNLSELVKSSAVIDEEDVVAFQKTRKGKSSNMKKSTDSDEWLPEAYQSPEKAKRKKDQFLGNRTKMMTEELSGSKKAKLSKAAPTEFVISTDRMKKSNLRKGDLLQVSINQPGNGVLWSAVEDQALVAFEHEFGSNWELLTDIVNSSCYIKGQFRTSKDCKERHIFLRRNMPMDRNSGDPHSLPGIPKGLGMGLLNLLQGPMEEDTLKFHLEQIIEAKKNHSQIQRNRQREKLQPHVTHLDAVSQIQGSYGRFLSPLEFPDERLTQPVSGQLGAQQNEQGSGTQNKTIDKSSSSTSFSGPNREAPLPKLRNIKPGSQDHTRSSVDTLEEAQQHDAMPKDGQAQTISRSIQEAPAVRNGNGSTSCGGTPQQLNNGQQEQVREVASLHLEDSRLEQQHRMQQMQQTLPQKQRFRDPLHYPNSPQQHHQQPKQPVLDTRQVEGHRTIGVQEQRAFPVQHFNTHSRQNSQQSSVRKSGLQTSGSQQHQDHVPQPTSFAEQHQQPSTFPISRVSQHNSSVDPRIVMQRPNSQYNHQCFSGCGPSQAARLASSSNHSTQWRPGQNSAGVYRGNQMPQVPPNSVDMGVFQHPRFHQTHPRPMKQMGAQRTMQAHSGVQFLPSSVAGGMRYQGPAQANFHPVYTGKTWQQPHGGNPAFSGGGGGGPERPIMPLTSTASTGNCLDKLCSTGDAGSATHSSCSCSPLESYTVEVTQCSQVEPHLDEIHWDDQSAEVVHGTKLFETIPKFYM